MNFRQKFTLSLLVTIVSSSIAFAQVVDIPDPNLRAKIHETLNLPAGQVITTDSMLQLTRLDASDLGIDNLSGLEFAINLRWLSIAYNPMTDLWPIAGLTKMDTLHMWATPVSDITPLANLTKLKYFHANYSKIADIRPIANLLELKHLALAANGIVDITPLAKLVNLTKLYLQNNQIVDVRPLAGLTALTVLNIEHNRITDHSPLNALTLTDFRYDQTCDMPPLPLQPRLENRSFPSIYQAWGNVGWSTVLNQPHLTDLEQIAQHDLYWCCPMHGGDFAEVDGAVVLRGSIDDMIESRDNYIAQNPNMIFLVSLRAVWDDLDRFPPDSDYWLRDKQGNIKPAWHMGLLNLNNPGLQKRFIDRAVAVSKCGLYDGIFIDGWQEPNFTKRGYLDGAIEILKGIRERVDDNFLILVNTNRWTAPVSAPYINGLFLESGVPENVDDPSDGFRLLEDTLSWAETNLRAPQINAPQGRAYGDEPLDSPVNLRWMRAVTALHLTFSDGYVLITTDMWEGVHQHWHYWYEFWNADLGQPVGAKSQLYQETEGLYIREFTNGWAVYNHSGAPQVITLPEEVQSVSNGSVGTEHVLPDLDGEIYLRVKPKNPADVNGDGVVNILDLTLVAQAFGKDGLEADVNGDGVVNVFDLVFVANQF